jgi:hypothetical protein
MARHDTRTSDPDAVRATGTITGAQVAELDALAERVRPLGIRLTRSLLMEQGVRLALAYYTDMANRADAQCDTKGRA